MKKVKCLNVCLILCLLLLGNTSCTGQESYHDVIKQLLKYGSLSNGMSMENMRPLFESQTEQVLSDLTGEEKKAKIKELVDAYCEGPLFEDMATLMQPHFEKHVSLADLKDYADVAATAQFQEVNTRANSAGEMAGANLMTGIMAFASGNTPEAIKPIECSDNYKKLFADYYEASDSDGVLDQMVTAMSQAMQTEAMDEQAITLFNKMMDYMKANFHTAMLNSFVSGGVSEDDLDYFSEIIKMPAYSGVLSATKDMLTDVQGLGLGMAQCYQKWLNKHVNTSVGK